MKAKIFLLHMIQICRGMDTEVKGFTTFIHTGKSHFARFRFNATSKFTQLFEFKR